MAISATSPTPVSRGPLSFNQEFLCMFDQGNGAGPFGPRYTLADGWRLRGDLDIGALRAALTDLVDRHEALRTSLVRGDRDRSQAVQPTSPPELEVRDLAGAADRDRAAQELINDVEAGTHAIGDLPLLRAVLGRFDGADAALVVNTHHTATDGWSMQLIIRDLAELYAARREGRPPRLPEAPSYVEFAEWERENLTGDAVAASREHWEKTLPGAEILALPADRPRPEGEEMVAAVERFVLDGPVAAAALDYAKAMRCSPFMVLLAAYNTALLRMTGVTDLVVPTITSNRRQPRFQETVGSFFNFVPLRTDLGDCATFRDVTVRTRATCLDTYANDVPFEYIATPELMRQFADPDRAVFGFQVAQFPPTLDGAAHAGVRIERIRRTLRQDISSHIPDGALWDLEVEPDGTVLGSLKYNSRVFDAATITATVRRFTEALRSGVADPDAPLE
ncbi:condensation domain-containing protein [Actinomadura darangshiensis]|nr:condensation domain-containing protein [Actinomadura darangshiensis]